MVNQMAQTVPANPSRLLEKESGEAGLAAAILAYADTEGTVVSEPCHGTRLERFDRDGGNDQLERFKVEHLERLLCMVAIGKIDTVDTDSKGRRGWGHTDIDGKGLPADCRAARGQSAE